MTTNPNQKKLVPDMFSERRNMVSDELPFEVVRSNSHDEMLARATNLPIGRGAFEAAARLYPSDLIELRQGAHVVAPSEPKLLE